MVLGSSYLKGRFLMKKDYILKKAISLSALDHELKKERLQPYSLDPVSYLFIFGTGIS